MADERYKTVSMFALPDEYQRQASEARRRRRMAEMLAQQAYQPGDIQNAPIPAAAPLVQGLQAFLAARAARKADEAEETAAKTKAQFEADTERQIDATGAQIAGRLMGGSPIRSIAPVDKFGLQEFQSAAPAFAQDMQRRNAEELTQRKAGDIQEVTRQSQYVYDPKDALRVGMTKTGAAALQGNPALAAMLARTMEKPDAEEYGTTPVKGADGNYYVVSKSGKLVQTNVKAPQDRDGGVRITNVMPGEKTANRYSEDLAGLVAKQDAEAIAAGDNAIAQIESAHRVRDLLAQNPITGTGAEARLGFEKALSAVGFTKGDKATVTENLISELGKTTLSAIRSSGLGAGQGFTNTDREFLEAASAGRKEATPENLKYLADLNERAGRAAIAASNRVRRRARELPQFKGLPNMFPDVVAPAPYRSRLPTGATLD
jgi:hypothetical protein